MPGFALWLLNLVSLHTGADAVFAWLAAVAIALLLLTLVTVCLAVWFRSLRFLSEEARKAWRRVALGPDEGIWDPLASRKRRLRAVALSAYERPDGSVASDDLDRRSRRAG